MEAAGLYGHGKDYEQNRYTDDYMVAAWGEGYFPYLYQNRPDPNYDPVANGIMSWDLYREMWGSNGEFVIDGNLTSVEYADRLKASPCPRSSPSATTTSAIVAVPVTPGEVRRGLRVAEHGEADAGEEPEVVPVTVPVELAHRGQGLRPPTPARV